MSSMSSMPSMSSSQASSGSQFPVQTEPQQFSQMRLELQEDFGRIVRRIITNSGAFAQPNAALENKFCIVNADWSMLRNEALLAGALGKFEVAEMMWLRALEVSGTFKNGDLRLPQTLDELASFYFSLKQYERAEAFAEQAMSVCRAIFGDYHSKVAYCANNLAGIYFSQKRCKKAEPLCVEVLNIYTRIYEPGHPDIGMAHANLAMLYAEQGKFQLALHHCESAYPIREQHLGQNHHLVRALAKKCVELLEKLGDHSKAAMLKQKATHNNSGWRLFDAKISLPGSANDSANGALSREPNVSPKILEALRDVATKAAEPSI